MCGESTRPGEAVPGWDVSAIGRKTTWPRGMTAVLLWTLHELDLRRCVSRRRKNGETGYGSKMRWRGVRHGDALQTNESFAMRRQDWKSFTSTSCTPKAKNNAARKAQKISRGTSISIMSVHDIFRVGVIEHVDRSHVPGCCTLLLSKSQIKYTVYLF